MHAHLFKLNLKKISIVLAVLAIIYIVTLQNEKNKSLVGKLIQINRTLTKQRNELHVVHNSYKNTDNLNPSDCFIESDYCFDLYRCIGESENPKIKISIYGGSTWSNFKTSNFSQEFLEFIETIINSDYYEQDPSQACILVPLIGFLNENDSEKNLSEQLKSLKL
jgi:hypothetical protein